MAGAMLSDVRKMGGKRTLRLCSSAATLATMSFRMPQNLSTQFGSETAFSAFEREIVSEKALSLGRAGMKVEQALLGLKESNDAREREAALELAAVAVYAFLVQRELCGLQDRRQVVEDYGIPRKVIARLGAKRKVSTSSAER